MDEECRSWRCTWFAPRGDSFSPGKPLLPQHLDSPSYRRTPASPRDRFSLRGILQRDILLQTIHAAGDAMLEHRFAKVEQISGFQASEPERDLHLFLVRGVYAFDRFHFPATRVSSNFSTDCLAPSW